MSATAVRSRLKDALASALGAKEKSAARVRGRKKGAKKEAFDWRSVSSKPIFLHTTAGEPQAVEETIEVEVLREVTRDEEAVETELQEAARTIGTTLLDPRVWATESTQLLHVDVLQQMIKRPRENALSLVTRARLKYR